MPRSYRLFIAAVVGCLILAFGLGWLIQPEKPYISGDHGYRKESASYHAGGANCEPPALDRLSGGKRIAKADACEEAEEKHRESTRVCPGLIESKEDSLLL